jgi:hypothetical protein
VSKTTALLDQAQPFLRDQYATVRKEVGPRLAHTRDLAVPMAMDASHKAWDMSNKVRSEYLPEAVKRTTLAAAVLRGAELERAQERRLRWKLVAAATAAGAALGAGAVMWQRRRGNEVWYEEGVDETKPADEMSADSQHEHEHH